MEESNSVAGHNPFAPPVARLEEPTVTDHVMADRGVRLVATILDGVAFGVVMLVVGFTAAAVGVVSSGWQSGSGAAFLAIIALPFLGFVGLQLWLLHQRGQTIGKIVTKIRVVRPDGSKPSIGRLIGLRILPMWIAGLVPFIGPLMGLLDSLLIFRDSHRCLHDDIADTFVVRV